MAYTNNFIRLSFGGSTAGGNEIWSCGLALIQRESIIDSSLWFAAVGTKVNELGTILEDYVGDMRTFVPAGVTIEWLKLAHIGTDGKYVEEPFEIQLTGNGYFNDNYVPQAAMTNILVSDKYKDPGKYNRFYLPTLVPGGGGQWKLNSPDQVLYLTALGELVVDINSVLEDVPAGTSGFVGVVSNTAGAEDRVVSKVRMGQIVDTQRRRRNKLPEEYIEAPVAL